MLEFLEDKSICLHSRKIFSLIDTNQIHTFANHLSQCSDCRNSHTKIKTILEEIDKKIPLVEMTTEEHKENQEYLSQLLKKSHKKNGFLKYLPW